MQDMNELLVQSIDTLPPLPKTVCDLQAYIDSAGANVEIDKVAQIISGDPLVTAKLLQLANSPFYGFSREITTIQQVINLLGVGNIRNIVIADSIKRTLRLICRLTISTPTSFCGSATKKRALSPSGF